jgi:sugar phosphate isomerase/epimerase
MAELGIRRINAVSMDSDLSRSFDQFGILAGLAASRGMVTTIEFVPGLGIADLPTALKAIRAVGRPDFRLLIDMMHLVRSGSGAKDVAALDPATIGYIQLCDVPLVPKIANYMQEAMFHRMAPGKGELPLLDILAALPRDLVIGLEVPMRAEAEAGIGPLDRLGPCVEAARSLLAKLDKEPV